jgi:sporulation protein YtfJ
MEKIKEMVDVNTVVGNPIALPDGITLIPVSKISCGFAGGGSDLPSKNENKELFGGGSGVGVNITPVAFIVVNNGDVRMMPVVSKPDTNDGIVNMIPDVIDKVGGLFKKDKTESED